MHKSFIFARSGVADVDSLMKQVRRSLRAGGEEEKGADNRESGNGAQSRVVEGLPDVPARGERLAAAHLRGL